MKNFKIKNELATSLNELFQRSYLKNGLELTLKHGYIYEELKNLQVVPDSIKFDYNADSGNTHHRVYGVHFSILFGNNYKSNLTYLSNFIKPYPKSWFVNGELSAYYDAVINHDNPSLVEIVLIDVISYSSINNLLDKYTEQQVNYNLDKIKKEYEYIAKDSIAVSCKLDGKGVPIISFADSTTDKLLRQDSLLDIAFELNN